MLLAYNRAHGYGDTEAPPATGAAVWYRAELGEASGHPFYQRLNRVLEEADSDRFCESRCQGFYHEKLGRPSLVPGM